jgi:hypothetical protein
MFASWLRQLFQPRLGTLRRRTGSSHTRKPVRPLLDSLETRVVPAFVAPAVYPTGMAVSASDVGDFNGDGKADIVVAGTLSGRGEIQVEMNNGDGTYTPGALYTTGNSPFYLKTGDFDGDGHLDVVTLASYYTGAMTTLKGNGDGTFQPYTPYTILTPPTEIEVADVNNDGHVDLITGNHYFNTEDVFLNNGTGTFAPQPTFAGGGSPTDLKLADLNGDGNLDLISANQSNGTVSVQINKGNGVFGAPVSTLAFTPTAEVVGDFNADGHPDVAVTSATSPFVSILLGNGDGTLQSAVTNNAGMTPLDIHAGDFNGDGKIDLVERTAAGLSLELGNGDGTFQTVVSTGTPAGTNTVLSGDFNGDGINDIATTDNSGAVSVLINDGTGIAGTSSAANLVLAAPTSTVAGANVPVTVSVVDASGNTVTDFVGTVTVLTSDLRGHGASYTFTLADAGTHTFNNGVSLVTAGPQAVAVSAPFVGTDSQTITVAPAPAARFSVTLPSSTVAGTDATISVLGIDVYGNMGASGGTIHFASNDAQASLPADYTFSPSDSGSHAFIATLKTAGYQYLTVTDLTHPGVTSVSSSDLVTPAAAASFSLIGGGGYIGSAHPVTIVARDAFGNQATGYLGVVHLASSDPNTVVGADSALMNGIGSILATPLTLGTQSLVATDSADASMTGSESIVVTPGWAVRFTATSLHDTVAGVSQPITVTAWDAFGNISTVYTGTVRIAGSDPRALSYYTFSAANQGVATFNVMLYTAGTQSVTLADYANPAVALTQSGITVSPNVAASIAVPTLVGTVAGVSQTFTISARDAYGNIATGYTGTLLFSSSDAKAVLPAAYTFTAADAGVHTFSVTFKSSGGQTLVVQDTTSPGNLAFTSSQRDIAITPAAPASISIRAQSNVTAGVAFTITVSIVDAFGNVVPTYTGKIHFSGPSGGGNLLPADYIFTAADAGVHVFSVTFTSTGTQTITIGDVNNGALKGSTQVKVVTSTTSTGGSTGGGTGGSGGGGGGGGGGKVITA